VGRAAAVLTLAAALVAWFEIAPHLDPWGVWPSVLLSSLVLIPATFLLLWLALPVARQPAQVLLPALAGFLLLAILLWQVDLPVASSMCKLAAYSLAGFAFLLFFQELAWVTLVAVLIPWVDAFSVWRGPTREVTEEHAEVFDWVAVVFVAPGGYVAQLGPPDVVFFALFLAASVRWSLRSFATWAGLTAGLSLTLICTVAFDVDGLPALPGIALGFLIPNADLLWRDARAARTKPAS
jgi:hypothetical protein